MEKLLGNTRVMTVKAEQSIDAAFFNALIDSPTSKREGPPNLPELFKGRDSQGQRTKKTPIFLGFSDVDQLRNWIPACAGITGSYAGPCFIVLFSCVGPGG